MPDGEGYTYVTSLDGYCELERCQNNCETCLHNSVTDQLECLDCFDGWTLNTTQYPFSCYKNLCDDDEFWNKTTLRCENCPDGCSQCSDKSCSSCDEGGYLLEVEDGIFTCVEECPRGQTYNFLSNKCQACKENCQVCDTATYEYEGTWPVELCYQCAPGFYLY